MKKKIVIAAGIAVLLLLTGCQSDRAEMEALRKQIDRLEQQISALEQQNPADHTDTVSSQESVSAADSSVSEQSSAPDKDTQSAPAPSTTYTMEELTAMVDAYVEKADAATPNGTVSENMEQFFSLKQEEKQIDHALDLHEDELENLYRRNVLTREEYKSLERDLERLEDRLDDAEDRLEYTFGIDD